MRPVPSDFRRRVRLLMMQFARELGHGFWPDDQELRRVARIEVGRRIRYWKARGRGEHPYAKPGLAMDARRRAARRLL